MLNKEMLMYLNVLRIKTAGSISLCISYAALMNYTFFNVDQYFEMY